MHCKSGLQIQIYLARPNVQRILLDAMHISIIFRMMKNRFARVFGLVAGTKLFSRRER